MRENKNCLMCTKEFLPWHKDSKYCSPKCRQDSMRIVPQEIKKCFQCGKKFLARWNDKSRRLTEFCSRRCTAFKNIKLNRKEKYQSSWVRFGECHDCFELFAYHHGSSSGYYRCELCSRIKKFDAKIIALKNIKKCIDCGELLTAKWSRNRCRACSAEVKKIRQSIHNKFWKEDYRKNKREEYLAEKRRYRKKYAKELSEKKKRFGSEQKIAYNTFVEMGLMPKRSFNKYNVTARRMAKQLNLI